MQLRIWGSRGSFPVSGKNYTKYGGRTSCVEIIGGLGEKKDERMFLDAGTGLGFAGLELAGKENITAHVLLSHAHLDHVMGIPFFMPLYKRGNRVTFWVPQEYCKRFREARGQGVTKDLLMCYPLYPMRPTEVESPFYFSEISENKLRFDGGSIEYILAEHYEGCVVYKIKKGTKTFVYAPDIADVATNSKRVADFCQGADLLIWDSVYTPEEINEVTRHKHTAIDSVISLAKKARVPRAIHFHHNPRRTDKELDKLKGIAKEIAGKDVKTEFARDDITIRF